jgi:hypothetical protein
MLLARSMRPWSNGGFSAWQRTSDVGGLLCGGLRAEVDYGEDADADRHDDTYREGDERSSRVPWRADG